MRILLDTHVYIWWLTDHPNLSGHAHDLITRATDVYVSSATIWEAAIKVGAGKLEADLDLLASSISSNGFIELPIAVRHAALVAELPDIHRDPFDRILVAQAISESLQLFTADKTLAAYSALVTII